MENMQIYQLGGAVEIKLLSSDDNHIVRQDTSDTTTTAGTPSRQSPYVHIEQTLNGWSVDLANFNGRIEVYKLGEKSIVASISSRD
jgi:hypothetical protein